MTKVQLVGTRELHTGTVVRVEGGFALVAWDSGVTAWCDRTLLDAVFAGQA